MIKLETLLESYLLNYLPFAYFKMIFFDDSQVTLFHREHFVKVNGFPNNFWGWGAEDDELRLRVLDAQLPILKPTLDGAARGAPAASSTTVRVRCFYLIK